MAKDKPESEKTGRIQQFRQTYQLTKKTDRWIGLVLLGAFLVVGGIGFAVFYFLLPSNGVLGMVMAVVGAVLFGTLASLIIFGRRAQRSAYAQMDGRPAPRSGCCAVDGRPARSRWRSPNRWTSSTAWSARPASS